MFLDFRSRVSSVPQLHSPSCFLVCGGQLLPGTGTVSPPAPPRSTRCQLKLDLMHKFMRCTGFVRACGHGGVDR